MNEVCCAVKQYSRWQCTSAPWSTGTLYLLRHVSHCFPVIPAAQWHSPVRGSQRPPLHSHSTDHIQIHQYIQLIMFHIPYSCSVHMCVWLTLAAIRAVAPVTWSTLATVRSINPRLTGTCAVNRVTRLNQCRCCITITLMATSAGIKAKCPILNKTKKTLPSTSETKQ